MFISKKKLEEFRDIKFNIEIKINNTSLTEEATKTLNKTTEEIIKF